MKTTLRKFVGFLLWVFLSWVPLGLHRIWMEGLGRSEWWMYPVAALFPVLASVALGAGLVPPPTLPLVSLFAVMPYVLLAVNDGLRFLRNDYQLSSGGHDAQ